MNKVCFIVNPKSGGRKKQKFLDRLNIELQARGIQFEIKLTQFSGHATLLCKTAIDEGFEVVVAVGGDGSVNEVAQSLAGTKASLGIIPMGSGNGLARHLKIPLNFRQSIETVLNGKKDLIDVCMINSNMFFSNCGSGFVADVVKTFSQTHIRKLTGYVLHVIRNFFKLKAIPYSIIADGEIFNDEFVAVNFSNSNQFGYNLKVTPKADLKDGLIDLVLVKKINYWQALRLLFDLMFNRLHTNKNCIHRVASRVQIESHASVNWQFDGEILLINQPAFLKVLPLYLNVIVPKN